MQVTVLAGGIGAARFLQGLISATGSTHEQPTVTVVGNTGDDIRLFGLQICPDLDSVMYTLGGGADTERGWGRANESFTVLEELRNYGAKPEWFGLGDRDIATHLVRTQALDAGYPLSSVTAGLAARWQLPITLTPMTDDRVETHVVIDDPDTDAPAAIHFQEWWVRHRAALAAREFVYVGSDTAKPAPGVIEAITAADVVILPPSNPVVSLAPILAVPGIRNALTHTAAPVVGISPIVGSRPVRGMADACLTAIGVDVSAVAVAAHYGSRASGGLLDAWIIDDEDADHVAAIRALGLRVEHLDTIFANAGVAQEVAIRALELAGELTT
ncbi:MAG: 2-phospho-L-lactate transferase [Candidatus Nanopelagicales bacterium]